MGFRPCTFLTKPLATKRVIADLLRFKRVAISLGRNPLLNHSLVNRISSEVSFCHFFFRIGLFIASLGMSSRVTREWQGVWKKQLQSGSKSQDPINMLQLKSKDVDMPCRAVKHVLVAARPERQLHPKSKLRNFGIPIFSKRIRNGLDSEIAVLEKLRRKIRNALT